MKLINKIKNNKFLFILLSLLTLFRIMIAIRIPLQLQADAMYDDYLFVRYAKSLLTFDWLGSFDQFTLAKGISFPFFLITNYLLGIPYYLALIVLYIFSIIVFVLTIKKIIKNKYYLSFLYLFLLFSPVMLHVENVQKVYRGGVLISFVLLVVSGIIGLYLNINDKKRTIYTILLSICLPFFWFLKEDSIWILPLLCVGALFTIYKVYKSKDRVIKKAIMIIIPFISLFAISFGYKSINYFKYGEFTITDRGGTYFKEMISDLLHIEGKNRDKKYWITNDMMNKAYDNSPTLLLIKEKMDEKYNSFWTDENGEINGDIIYWVIKDAAAESGLYKKGGKEVNNFYKKVHNELQNAFDTKKLKKNNDFYISSVVKGITKEEIPDYINFMGESLNSLILHDRFDVGLYPSTGETNELALFDELTMSQTINKDANKGIYKLSSYYVKICFCIKRIYSMLGYLLFFAMLIGLCGFIVKFFYNLVKKTSDETFNSMFLITLGLVLTCFVQFFGTTFFCRFLSIRKVYDYTSIIYPLLQIAEFICLIIIVKFVKNRLNKFLKENKYDRKIKKQ